MFESREIFDISPVINSRLAVFPGDTPFQRHVVMDVNKGDLISLSWIQSTVHLGAHTDAPNHYAREGQTMEARDLRLYLGAAQVIGVSTRFGERIRPQDFANVPISAPRVLFKTRSFPDPTQWRSDFMALSEELVDFLVEKKVCLVGIDTPSIDLAEDKILESHQCVARHNLAILEGIVLDKVTPGIYQLIALPLPIEGADASPVRAILLR